MHVGCFEHFKNNWFPLLLNFLALVGIAVHGIVYASILPDNVVYHYDAYGNPDRSANTRDFIALYWLASLVATFLMVFLSFLFSANCCAVGCSSPEEASYTANGRRYLRLTVSSWALWLNLSALALIFTIFAILLQNALKSFDKATTFGVYMPFFIFVAALIILVYIMFTRIQSAKRLMYAGYFKDEEGAEHSVGLTSEENTQEMDSMKPSGNGLDRPSTPVKVRLVEDVHESEDRDEILDM